MPSRLFTLVGCFTLAAVWGLLVPLNAFAAPEAYPTYDLTNTLGVVELRSPITLYKTPKAVAGNAQEFIHWDCKQQGQWVYRQTSAQNEAFPSVGKETFLVHDCQRQQTLATVVDEAEDGWLKLRLQGRASNWAGEAPAEGWVPPMAVTQSGQPAYNVQTWLQFMRLYTKELGFHWLARVPETVRYVRLSPKDEAPLVTVTMVKGMRVVHVRGNWMMVELRDMGQEYPIGWLRWRDEAGNLFVWPNFEPSDAANYKYLAPANPPDIQHMYNNF
ncbi:MAG: hypothetical protein ACKO34_05275 [Vampirovibrionales bacterium]